MTFTWERLSVYSIAIDGQSYALSPNSLHVDVKEGIHRVEIFSSLKMGYSCTMAVFIFILSIIISVVQLKLTSDKD